VGRRRHRPGGRARRRGSRRAEAPTGPRRRTPRRHRRRRSGQATREVVEALVPALEDVARRTGVDVALVLADDEDHAAVQACRSRLDGGPGAGVLTADAVKHADELGVAAANGHLVLFLGAGVSLAAGLPTWQELLGELAKKAGLEGLGLEYLDPQNAAQLAYRKLKPEAFEAFMTDRFTLKRHALAHGLLAGLRTQSVVTTNYDNGYAAAAAAVQPGDRPLKVLPRE
jgi:hypothetical protein